MAEFALGLTKTAVEGTLSLVKSAVEEEKKLRDKVQNDLVFIGSEFEVMRSFLRVANKERARNDEVVLTLVRQLRTLAFDVEDCVEYVVHLDLDKSSSWGWLRRLWQNVNCRAPPLPLDVAVADIKHLKARVEDVSERNMRYTSLILHGSDNSDNKQQQPVTVMPLLAEEAPYAATTTTSTTYPSSAAFHVLRDAWEATGKWSSNKCNLQQLLLIAGEGEGDHDLRVISIWASGISTEGGGGGVPGASACPGTASILNKAYCDPEICEKFKICAWVKLTHPFNHDEFVKSLLAQFYASSSHQEEVVTQEDLNLMKAKLMQQMREQRYLLVLEDVLTVAEWHVIRVYLPDSKNGSRILLSTPQLGIALLCTGEPYQVSELRSFSGDNKFLCAFSKKEKIALKDEELSSQQKVLSKSIVDKCGGLPKVIAAIGEVSRSSESSRRLEYLNDNDNFMGTLETEPVFHGLRPLFSWMQSYFDACSDSLKPCIFYLSIFSAEKNIRLQRLLWRWIAEGYCRDTSDGTTFEKNGEKFVSELVKLSIIQDSASSKVFCQINGFFHEYIISRPMEDNLVFTLEGRCSLNLQLAGQHLTIRSSWDRNEIVYESIDFSRLRSLTVFGKWESFFICSKKVNMRLLRVLDLEDATDVTNEDLDKIAKLLTRLKFLSLRGCREITRLPISTGGMRQLQTLDIRGTSIVTLPLFITKLQKLRYIRAGTTEVCDWEGDIVAVDGEENRASSAAAEGDIVPADGEEDRASAAAVVGDIVAADGEEDRASAAAEEGDVVSADGEGDRASSSAQAVTNLPAAAATPKEILVLPAEPGSSVSCNNKPRTLVSSFFLSKLCRRGGGALDNNGPAAGVTVPADIGNLSVLHTLGVVKVNAHCSKDMAIFQELKKLTQLRKLGVSGINKENIKAFCEAISHHAHLKSLSVELDKDDKLDDNIPEPPKTIQSLKLYGRVHKLLLVWMKHLHYLEKLYLTIEKPEESRDLPELSNNPGIGHLRIRPIQGGELHIGPSWIKALAVEIQCSSILHIKIGDAVFWNVGVLKVHFSGGSQSSLQISGLSKLCCLREVWLKGYTNAHKQDMQRQIDEMHLQVWQKRPVLKLVRPSSS